jgi:beta-galactosidase
MKMIKMNLSNKTCRVAMWKWLRSRDFGYYGLLFFAFSFMSMLSFHSAIAAPYIFDLGRDDPQIISGFLHLGFNRAPNGEVLGANSLYYTKNGKPWLPVMGEFHFTRYPRSQWEHAILQMKACGVNIVATYLFWIHFEEIEGRFDWSGNRDLRYFAQLCAKHNMYLFLRIGPWCHGEVRNGGFPDWLLKKCHPRTMDPKFLAYVDTWDHQIASQIKGLCFKDGGPIIGVQIENEYGFDNPAGLKYMLTLKRMAVNAGIDVPFYTATGWPSSDQKQPDLIPVWGGYPEAPWDQTTKELPPSGEYLFHPVRSDPPANASQKKNGGFNSNEYKGYLYPYTLAELGGGVQDTYHRRPIIVAKDVVSMAYVKLGEGANLMGYYVFHGGSNPIGKLSTMQESRATGYPNDLPIISYDFYAPISEWGELRPSYYQYKDLHLFINDFGSQLAQCYAVFPNHTPTSPSDTTTLRCSVRAHGDNGYIFISNYEREVSMRNIQGVQFELKFPNGEDMLVPEKPFTVRKDATMILPFNLSMNGATLRYATAQPLCKISVNGDPLYVFFTPPGMSSEYVFKREGIRRIWTKDSSLYQDDKKYRIADIKPGEGCIQTILLSNGRKIRILTLTDTEAIYCWKADAWGRERIFICRQGLTFPKGAVHVHSEGENVFNLDVYPPPINIRFERPARIATFHAGIFTRYQVTLPFKRIPVKIRERNDNPMEEATCGSDAPQPGPQYGPIWENKPFAPYWRITLPKNSLSGLANAYLKIHYVGDTTEAYLGDTLVADNFYAGPAMIIGLNRFLPQLYGTGLLLQIVPLIDKRDIYFQDDIRLPLLHKVAASVKSVSVVPEYEITITRSSHSDRK